MFKEHVLFATDFSESSMAAFNRAKIIAACDEASLTVLFSYRLIPTDTCNDIVSYRRKTEDDSRLKFAEMKKIMSPSVVPITFVTEIGFYSDNIENYARKNSVIKVVFSESMANIIEDHGPTLYTFLKSVHVPLEIVPDQKLKVIREINERKVIQPKG